MPPSLPSASEPSGCTFLKHATLTAGSLVGGFIVPARGRLALVQGAPAAIPLSPNAFLHIGRSGRRRARCGCRRRLRA